MPRKAALLFKKQKGATAIEYAFIVTFIAVAIIGVLLTIGPKLSPIFQAVQDNLKTS